MIKVVIFAGTVPDDWLDYLPRSESKVIGPRAPCDHRLVNVTASRRTAAASDGHWFAKIEKPRTLPPRLPCWSYDP